MEIYPKMTGASISIVIKSIIDDYLDESLSEDEARQKIEEVLSSQENRLKIRKRGEYTATFKSKMGVERLNVFGRLYHR